MNKSFLKSGLVVIAALVLASCSKTEEFQHNPDNALQIESVSGISPFALTTKAVITGNTLPDSEAATGIGIFVTASDGGAYDGHNKGYTNVNFANSGSGWSTATPVYLSDTEGKLYGYFPHNADATDLQAIPVESSLNGTDYLYAESQTVSHSNKNVSLQMKHALSRLHLTIKKGENFTADAPLSKITLTSTAIDVTGTMDLVTGAVTATKKASETGTVELPTDGTITAEGIEKDILLVPADNSEGKKGISISLLIDGKPAGITLSGDNGLDIRSGIQNNVTLTIEDTGIKVAGIGVGAWGDGGSQTVEVGGHKVTVKLADEAGLADDVLTNVKADGSNVIIRASSYAGEHLKCTLPGGGLCPQSKTANMAYTFTLPDIASDITATIGYAKAVTITKVVTPDGSATIEVTGDCYEGETVTLSANENYDYYSFVEWQDADGEKLEWTNPQDITLTSDLTVKAIFRNNSVLSGVFTVNGSNRKVLFSRGNLFYDGSKYCLEKNQYDVTATSGNESESHVGHFYWSSDAAKARSLLKYTDSGKSDDVFFANHPESFEVNGLKGWSVLKGGSEGEWDYLLNTRKTTYGTGVLSDANHRYAMVKVYGMEGLLIFPDEFSWPDDAGTEPQTFNTKSSDWNNLDYTKTQFEALQTAGCVFLPAAGYRRGDSDDVNPASVNGVDSGYYWSASPNGLIYAYDLYFSSYYVVPSDDYNRDRAYSVRLVTDIK